MRGCYPSAYLSSGVAGRGVPWQELFGLPVRPSLLSS